MKINMGSFIVKLDELKAGETFLFENDLWLVTDAEIDEAIEVVRLNDGAVCELDYDTPVQKMTDVVIDVFM